MEKVQKPRENQKKTKKIKTTQFSRGLGKQKSVLPRWEGRACPRCAHGTLSTMYYCKVRKAWVHRCSARSCDVKIQPHSFHPIFFQGNGQSLTPLGLQAAILHCALVNVPVTSVPALLNVERKTAERIYTNLKVAAHEEPRSEDDFWEGPQMGRHRSRRG